MHAINQLTIAFAFFLFVFMNERKNDDVEATIIFRYRQSETCLVRFFRFKMRPVFTRTFFTRRQYTVIPAVTLTAIRRAVPSDGTISRLKEASNSLLAEDCNSLSWQRHYFPSDSTIPRLELCHCYGDSS